eukprot:GEMP01052377.1.p1 GENE.GEMP01052377.1~~GEMP01052377.1.p1  ORF type:complete len:271 (+),score=35.01 GEMP01052377.1:43-855(+)
MELVALSAVLSSPLDSWKHRAQGPHASEPSAWRISEGTRPLRGMGYHLTHATLTPAFLVATYNFRRRQDGPYIAGLKARIYTTILLQPLEYLRSAKQAGNSNLLHTIANVGLGCLWRGLGATLARDVAFTGIYWASVLSEDRTLPFVGAAVATCVTHPLDVIKTKMQTHERVTYKNGYQFQTKERFFQTARELYAKEGIQAFSTGLVPRLLKIIPLLGILGVGAYEMGWVINGDGFSMLGPMSRSDTDAFVHPDPESYAQIEIRSNWRPN